MKRRLGGAGSDIRDVFQMNRVVQGMAARIQLQLKKILVKKVAVIPQFLKMQSLAG